MPLWGLNDTLADKPKIHGRSLLDATQTPGELDPRTGIYATTAGWVQGGVGRTGKNLMPEVLVAIRGLTTRTGAAGTADAGFGAAAHAAADLTSFNWNITTFDKSAGGTLSVTANFNEAVDVTGSPKLVVTGTGGRNHNLIYDSGTGSNRLTFILAIGAANAATNAADVLSIGANSLAQVGGSTIVDDVGGATSVITNSAGVGTATGTITVVA
jgi:hypothetical protein